MTRPGSEHFLVTQSYVFSQLAFINQMRINGRRRLPGLQKAQYIFHPQPLKPPMTLHRRSRRMRQQLCFPHPRLPHPRQLRMHIQLVVANRRRRCTRRCRGRREEGVENLSRPAPSLGGELAGGGKEGAERDGSKQNLAENYMARVVWCIRSRGH